MPRSKTQLNSLLIPFSAERLTGRASSQQASSSGGGGGGVGPGPATVGAVDTVARNTANAALALATTALQPGDVAEDVFDGTVIDLQDRDGTVGETSGTLVYGIKSEDTEKARMLRVTDRGIVVDSSNSEELLSEMLQLLVEISELLEGR